MTQLIGATLQTGRDANLIGLFCNLVLGSAVGALLLAAVQTDLLPGNTFLHRFVFAFWRYCLPACSFSGLVYWFVLR